MAPRAPHSPDRGHGPDSSRIAAVVACAGGTRGIRGRCSIGRRAIPTRCRPRTGPVHRNQRRSDQCDAVRRGRAPSGGRTGRHRALGVAGAWRSTTSSGCCCGAVPARSCAGPAALPNSGGSADEPGRHRPAGLDRVPAGRLGTARRTPRRRQGVAGGGDDLSREQPDGGLRRREPSSPLPPSDTARPIDYLDVRITAEHVLTSAAIPALLPAVDVSTPDAARGWYADGGIRLNAPLKPVLSPGWPKRGLQSRKLLCTSCYRIEPSRGSW